MFHFCCLLALDEYIWFVEIAFFIIYIYIYIYQNIIEHAPLAKMMSITLLPMNIIFGEF